MTIAKLTEDAETEPQDQDTNLSEVVVDFEDIGNNDNQTDSSHIGIVTVDDDDGSTSTPTLTKLSQPDVSGDILLFGNLIKNLELSTTRKPDKVKWNGDMTDLKDFVALVLKVEGTWKNNTKLPTFKSKSLSITWYKTKTKTLQFQGADTDDFKTYVKDLVIEYVEGMRKNMRNQVGPSSVANAGINFIHNHPPAFPRGFSPKICPHSGALAS